MGLEDDARRELEQLAAAGRLRTPRVVEGRQGAVVNVDGVMLVNFASNDYLGLAGDPRIAASASEALLRLGVGSGASRLIIGNHREHVALEAAVADWMRCAGVRVFGSGYAANVGVVTALTGAGDTVFSDELNHASIIDGCRLSRARVVVYRHGDLSSLAVQLAEVGGRKLVITESVFSMDGDVAPVAELAALCRREGATLVVDEAHAVGVFGPEGRGVAAEHDVTPDVLIGTFGKALGTSGAFAATSRSVADVLWNRARPFVFSTGTPPAVATATRTAVELVRGPDGAKRRTWLHELIRLARTSLGTSSITPIMPVIIGDDQRVVSVSDAVRARGYLVAAVRPPTVPEGTARLRVSLSAAHTSEQVVEMARITRSVMR
jgi:8-amino-7-oxononanoate synthase